MGRNIIICADGTGNSGGESPDTNVYKLYKAIDRHLKGNKSISEQLIYYDNGVGTQRNKYLRALGGAFGFGFGQNVRDIYKFLARHYEKGDRVFFFGFSRGASTVRACNGFISKCGLVNGRSLRNCELEERVNEAFQAYRRHESEPKLAEALKADSGRSHGAIPIHFIGVWDTVVALGFPKWVDKVGPASYLFDLFFTAVEGLVDRICLPNLWGLLERWGLSWCWAHKFYYYRLTDNVAYACQALAIDDERTAFWPHVWREQGRAPGTVEQVWFAGMHSNVGGGYGRSGMASVALHWMMLRAKQKGLVFEKNAVEKAFEDSHVHGRMYDSRDGMGILYRYHPREIEALCAGRVAGNIKVHSSVMERIEHRTANYAPGQLPAMFDVVESNPRVKPTLRNPGSHPDWLKIRNEIDLWVYRRKWLYETMLSILLILVGVAWWFRDVELKVGDGLSLAGMLDVVLPDFFDGLLQKTLVSCPWTSFIVLAIFITAYLWVRGYLRNKTVDACEQLRHLVIGEQVEVRDDSASAA